VSITTNVVSSNTVKSEGYSIQHYVIKFVSESRQLGGFHRVLRLPPPIKLLKVALSTIYLNQIKEYRETFVLTVRF